LVTPVAFSLFDDLENWLHGIRRPAGRLKLIEPAQRVEIDRVATDRRR